MVRRSAQYKRGLVGRAYFRKFVEFTGSIGFGLLTFVVAEKTNIMGASTDRALIDAAARATGTKVGSVQPVIEIIDKIMHRVNFGLEVILALITALIAFTVIELITRIMTVDRQVTVENLYEADPKVVTLVDTILDATSRFQNAGRRSPKVQSLLSEYLELRKEAFVGFLQRIADLDIDIDSSSERSFTMHLVDIADNKISAVSLDEEEFYSGEADAEKYLREQIGWLAKSDSREITRVFVEPKPTKQAEIEKFRLMLSYHRDLLNEWKSSEDKAWTNAIGRYKYLTISHADFLRITREDADLVIYDDAYIRKGIIGPDETRRAQFRTNSADVVDAVMKFRDLEAMASAPRSYSTETPPKTVKPKVTAEDAGEPDPAASNKN
jgi:hypothetical protein